MALQVWLPLRGNLRNQGLSPNIIICNSATYESNGKIGQCLKINNYSSISTTIAALTNKTQFSCSFWLKMNSGNTFSQFSDIVTFGIANSSSSSSFRCEVTNTGGTSINWYGNGFITSDGGAGALTTTLNTWTHIAVTIDDTTVKTYQDGILKNTYTIPTSYSYHFTGTFTFGNSGMYCSLNDVRVYDNCLSSTEVKEISKGLVLHYPLNREGWGQENNIKTAIVQNRGCSNFVYNSSTNEWTMTCPTGSTTWGYGIVLNDRAIAWKSGESWLVSMEVYTPRAIRWQMDINNKPDLADISSYTGNDYDDQRVVNTNGVQGSYQLQAGWNKLWFTQRAPSTYGLTNYSTNWGVVTTNETSAIDIKIKNIKGEVIGSGLTLQPTPWCPNSSDTLATTMGLNSTTEYDCSGFCNNGTRSGVTYSSDTPKYQVSTVFDTGTDTVTVAPCYSVGQTIDTMTCAIWFKTNTLNSTAPNQVSLGENAFFRFRIATATSIWYYIRVGSTQCSSTFSCKTLTDNNWHHIAVVFDKGYVYVYIDGNIIGTGNHTGTATYMTCNNAGTTWHLAGYSANSENFIGSESDFRIYATALSADDVKSLYQNEAYIDSSGTIYGQIHN